MRLVQLHARLEASPSRAAKALRLGDPSRAGAQFVTVNSVRGGRRYAGLPRIQSRDAYACGSRPAAAGEPRDVRTFAAKLAEALEYFYRIVSEIIKHGHKRAENRYNERVVKRAYQHGCLVRVLQHARNRNVFSKLDTQYFGLCRVLEVRSAQLTLRELDTACLHG